MSKIKGGDMMLFIGGKSIAFATSHTLSLGADTSDTSNKDEGGGGWASSEVTKRNWSANSENLVSADGAGNNFDDLFDIYASGQAVDAVFAVKKETATDVPSGGWTNNTTAPAYKGKVIITSLELNAPNGENATFTAEFTGVGALEKVTATVAKS